MNTYDVGDMVRMTGTFTNSAAAAVDPSSVTVQYLILKPALTAVTTLAYGVNSVVKAATGSYYADVAVNSDGEWHYRWNGFGANAAGVEGMFQVRVRTVG